MIKPKIITIVGQTATGKSNLAVKIAKKYNGEIISCDSRQVYKGLNLGTGKITRKDMGGVRHYMLDIVSTKKTFTVSDFQRKAKEKIEEIIKKEKLPILAGGTGFYIDVLTKNIKLPNVPPNKKLREKLEDTSLKELANMLKKISPESFSLVDIKNKRRIIRAIEISSVLGKMPKTKAQLPFNTLYIGLKVPREELKTNIRKRLSERIKKGMIKEVRNLHKDGLYYKKMEALGLEYRYISRFLRGILKRNEMLDILEKEIFKYAKRQETWFKKNKKIKWFLPKDVGRINSEIKKFLGY